FLAGEWADSTAFSRCRLVEAEWPAGLLPGPAFEAPEEVLVGAIVKPSLGLSPGEVAETAGLLAAGGADLVKDDELLGDPPWCPLEERVPAVAAAILPRVRYAANVTGPAESRLRRAARAADLGGGVGPRNARAQVELAGVESGVMVLLGSAAYEGGSPEDAVRATVESLRPKSAAESA